jgi:hypothetical protein
MLSLEQPVAGKLEKLCIADPAAFNRTHELVKAHLFSRYEGRRAYALRMLQRYWDGPVEVDRAENNGLVRAFIRFSPTADWYSVGQYAKDEPTSESVPTAKERAFWQ